MVSKPTPANTEVIKAKSLEAIKELQAVADKNGLSFEQVFQDPAYAKLAASTYSYH